MYIEREALLSKFECIPIYGGQFDYDVVIDTIVDFPAAAVQPIVEGALHDGEQDVAPVVRCKECKHYQKDMLFGNAYCDGRQVKPDDFCSYGERKETDGG